MENETLPLPVSLTDKIRGLKRGQSLHFGYIEGISARAVASHIGNKLGRKFTTRRIDGGITMWRKK